MEITQIVGFGLVAAVLVVILRQYKPEIALLVSLAAGIMLFMMVLGKIGAIVEVLKDLSNRANVNLVYLGVILKIVGIAYIADFGAQLCRDAGEGALAAKIEFAAKILILVLAIPIVMAVLDILMKILG
ncbi:stage III sporulation protein AD [Candidatus Desulforudis audaxviator]|uniref:Putative sporulation protein n=1 Tax=Desulforudis audaxviator (strain MP104C) TaxID=477974 RepID=B1I3B0_DESAP|nr:stage III sporulation protein AD [Candidatus Desulforudis audaxviator]ACA59522.1 putative sporulation protein [Candidatus Desulforudis audaxviator MP104C]AZK59505.1 Stage III sporulation protein AD [Candidatus Desulforudis audaxviator]